MTDAREVTLARARGVGGRTPMLYEECEVARGGVVYVEVQEMSVGWWTACSAATPTSN